MLDLVVIPGPRSGIYSFNIEYNLFITSKKQNIIN